MILLTCFDAFGKNSLNSSLEVISEIDDNRIEKIILPTKFHESFKILEDKIKITNPSTILMFGQAGGRPSISFEKIALNVIDTKIPDNNNLKLINKKIENESPDGLFTNVDLKKIINWLNNKKIPCYISYTAGTYVCNYLYYSVLNYIMLYNQSIKAVFVHLPYITEQVVNQPNIPSAAKSFLVDFVNEIINYFSGNEV